MSNGHRPDPPKKDSRIAQALRTKAQAPQANLMDTLYAVAGRKFATDTLPDFLKGEGLLGHYPIGSDTIQLARHLFEAPRTALSRETKIHETGHLVNQLTNQVPSGAALAKRGGHEQAARAFTRAYLALQALRPDTTNTAGVIDQFTMGIHPSLSRVERERGNIPGTQRVLAELLGLPIFAGHPLASQRERLLFEAPGLR